MKKKLGFAAGLIVVILISIFAFQLHSSAIKSKKEAAAVEKKVDTKQTKVSTNNKTNVNKNDEKAKNATSDVNNTPSVKQKVIVVDPGHANKSNLEKEPISPGSAEMKIKDGGGAEGVVTKTPEYSVNMKVSMKLKALLEKEGYIVKMTKTEDSQSLGNVERAEIGNKENADLVIRIHADSSDSSSANGASMLVPEPINENTKSINEKSMYYGKTVLNTLVSEVGMNNRGVVQRNDMTGFNWSKVPVILIEMGFLSNPQEDQLLCSDDYENKLAQGLAHGIDAAVKASSKK
ncbi:N-acetylmuramoyl-L-alanine amidase [Clostridium sp. P21]|uniref:N-acetylmuramoyl-L-alanine amidase n=1 Tax=Clostridium muellerianum TaxID=2716538 RepID=A0A7Y0EDJ0_9CLOT|nr:N-acetylmuramoyl-L-alanine amidase [Clostridium muellerianum]NMM61401.1 N-acetylmuramoyl-L-alanine amidase [Clostridium muellerianum]